MPLAEVENITINKPLATTHAHAHAHTHTHTHGVQCQGMTESRIGLSLAEAAVVAPFAHMLADAHTHTLTHTHAHTHAHRNHLWTHPWEGSELWRSWLSRTDTHTQITTDAHTHWTPEPPLVGVSPPHRGSLWGVCCSTLLQGPRNAGVRRFFFFPWLLFLGWIVEVHSLAHFPLFLNILVPSVQAANTAPFPPLQIETARPFSSDRQYDTTENLCNKPVRKDA